MSEASTHIDEILKSQERYFLEEKTLSPAVRKENLKKLKQILKENEIVIAEAIYKDFGKSYFEVMENELGLVYAEITSVLRKLSVWTKAKRARTSLVNLPGKSWIYPIPYGNTLIISPWNYPIMLALIPVISAIAAGNTIVLKPSELTYNTSSLLAQIINQAFPSEFFFVMEGGIEVSSKLLSLKFNKIFFTGSTRVGKIVMRAAAENLTPVTLELGGKNPVIVLADCDIKMTAKRLVWGKFHNGGFSCVSPDHIYVHESIKDELIEEVIKNIKKMFGPDPMKSEALPRIINDSNYERLIKLIDSDKVIYGGKATKSDMFLEPTVMLDVDEEDAVMQEEVFGPIMPFLTFTDLNAVVKSIKSKASPLALYVFTNNKRLAKTLHSSIRSGGGMINDTVIHFVNSPTPFGGIGDSGMGSYHGKTGFDCFSHSKSVIKKPLWFELWVKYPPYTKNKLRIVKTLLR